MAAVERNLLNGALIHGCADGRGSRVDHRCRRRDLDRFGSRRDGEAKVLLHNAADSSTTSFTVVVSSPGAFAMTEYRPTGSEGTTYSPDWSVVNERSSPVARLRTVTAALGTAAPLGSVTVP